MAFRRVNFECDVKLLIKSLSGFQEEDENLNICVNFVLSNLNYHRFLDPDSHKIKRSICGLADKFRVHSQLEKANALQQLVQDFLSTINDDSPTKIDSYYAMLSLLLLLANKPTHHDYKERIFKPEAQAVDPIDWKQLLMEGEEIVRVFPESPVLSDDDDDDDDDDEKPAVPASDADDGFNEELSTLRHEHVVTIRPTFRPLPFSDPDRGEGWLAGHVMKPYWKSSCVDHKGSGTRATQLNFQWAEYSFSIDSMPTQLSNTVLEQHIVRESLWVLSGVGNLHIFQRKDGILHVNTDICVSHLTEDCLQTYLAAICRYGNIVHSIRSFISDLIGQDSAACRTYLAFAAVLNKHMAGMEAHMSQLEKTCITGELSLSGLYAALKERFMELDLLDGIFKYSINPYRHLMDSNRTKAVGLLSYLYDTLLALDAYGECRDTGLSFLFPVWLDTCCPYLDIIHDLLTVGRLEDHTQEFIISRDSSIKPTDANYWTDAYKLVSADCTAGPGETSAVHTQFLDAVVDSIVLTGKSMETLHYMSRLSDVFSSDERTLYAAILSELRSPTPDVGSVTNAASQHPHHRLDDRDEADQLILSNFKQFTGDTHQAPEENSVNLISSQSSRLGSLPLIHRMEKILHERILARSRFVTNKLLMILVTDYNIKQHLTNIRRFFLMKAGDVMYDFYTNIFEKLRCHEAWSDISYLTSLLQDCLSVYNDDSTTRLFIQLDQSNDTRRQPISALDSLKLDYKVTWPVDVVLNQPSMRVYSQIFTFVLQIKRVKYCLDYLLYREFCGRQAARVRAHAAEAPSGDAAVYHRIQLFRMKLMHFVNSLHHYIMEGVLHKYGHVFADDLSGVGDLAEFLDLHDSFVMRLFSQCLLAKNVILLKEAIMKALNLSLVFQARLENEGLSRGLSIAQLMDMEQEFGRCIQFVSSFLHNIIKHTVSPHLEYLAACVDELKG